MVTHYFFLDDTTSTPRRRRTTTSKKLYDTSSVRRSPRIAKRSPGKVNLFSFVRSALGRDEVSRSENILRFTSFTEIS